MNIENADFRRGIIYGKDDYCSHFKMWDNTNINLSVSSYNQSILLIQPLLDLTRILSTLSDFLNDEHI
jgi:hypothetical protein